MKDDFLNTGRVNQKYQTRATILEAAQQLMRRGKDFSLEDVAEVAGISRATIYRYFSNVNILVAEAGLDIDHRSPEVLFEEVSKLPLAARLLYIQRYYNDMAQKHEPAFRRYLSVVLQESVNNEGKEIRGARRVETLKKALEPYQNEMDKDILEKLIAASSILMGIDPLVTGKDVCRLNNEQTNEVLEWALTMMVKGSLKN